MSQLVALNPNTTSATIGNNTVLDLMKQVMRETQLGEFFATGGAAADGTVSMVDMRHLGGQYSKEYWRGAWFFLPQSGEFRPVRRFIPEEGRISWDEPLDDVDNKLDYGYMLIRWPHPEVLLQHIIDTFNQDVWLPTVSATSFVPDFDMELHPSSVSLWWDADPGVTVTKDSTPPLSHGLRCLKVAATTNPGAASPVAGFAIAENKGYHLSVMAHSSGGGSRAYIKCVDRATAHVIAEHSWDGQGWARMFIDLQIGTTTEVVDIELGCDTTGKYARFKDLIFYPFGERNIPLPGWVREADQVKKIFRLDAEHFENPELWLASYQGRSQAGWVPQIDKLATSGPGQLTSHTGRLEDPLYFVAKRQLDLDGPYIGGDDYVDGNYDPVHTSLFNINMVWAVAALKMRLYQAMDAWPGSASYDKDWLKAQKQTVERQKNQCMMTASREMDRFLTADEVPLHYKRNFYGS